MNVWDHLAIEQDLISGHSMYQILRELQRFR